MNKLTYYNGGENQHRLSQILTDAPDEVRTFPSGVFLFEHPSGRLVMYDTGHPESFNGCGIRGIVYQRVLPSTISDGDTIVNQLKNDGISTNDISDVVLSHLHPDHIGGLRYFTNANVIISSGIAQTIQNSKIKQGFFKALLPEWLDDTNTTVLSSAQLRSNDSSDIAGFDVFNDESFVITELPGHAKGQLGAFVLGQTLLAADASWGLDMLPSANKLKPLPKAITDDYKAYLLTAERLQRLDADGIDIRLSHDEHPKAIIT